MQPIQPRCAGLESAAPWRAPRAVMVLCGAALVLMTALLPGSEVPASTLTGAVEIWEPGDPAPVKLATHENAVIFVAGFSEAPAPRPHPLLIQQNKSFLERVLVITQNETVDFPNHDPLFHNVWSRSPARPFDLGLYRAPNTKSVTFPNVGIVTVFCNIHANMISSILVLPNNKYAKTGADGTYRIEAIPPGTHLVYAWVEGAVPVKREVQFAADGTVQEYFRLQLLRISIKHLDKDGKPYKSHNSDNNYNDYGN